MRTLPSIASLLFASTIFAASVVAQQPTIQLWPKGELPEGSKIFTDQEIAQLKAKETEERITFVQDPQLEVFQPAPEDANGCAVVVCPGGGYNILAYQKEGVELARWFNSFGVTAFVLKYRVPRRTFLIHREPMQDVQRAIRLVRSQSEKWKIDQDRLGVLGFSAGGHLTLMAGLQSDEVSYQPVDEADQLSALPNFICPIYAAYMADGYRDDVAELGPLMKVTQETPPTFMAVTMDDRMRGAQAALLMVELKKNKVPAELHLYAKGGHGYGIRPSDKPVSKWNEHLQAWMKSMKLLEEKTK